ncbi:SitA6 family polymorphic toxin lipoprotein [Myxococcus faecalis]|uniref:SitA6 family polymorphic toxin lipoprotein n=1 Tax=Myxococcus faecalis TaxID=3115646 RepID=UPI003DA3E61F
MSRRLVGMVLLLLSGCTSAPQFARGDELFDTGVEDSAESCASSAGHDEDHCHAPACDDEGCGLYRCEDLASPPYALRVAPGQAASGATARIQRYWGGAIPLPGRTPVFIIPWYRREELPSATSVRKAIAEWKRRPKERHHIFPRAFQPYFATIGIEIHKYTLLVAVEEHQRVHAGANGGPWNRDWRIWIDENRDTASRADHFRQGGKMVERYGLVGMPTTYWQRLSLLTASGE